MKTMKTKTKKTAKKTAKKSTKKTGAKYTSKDGNAFVAFRCPRKLLTAFKSYAARQQATTGALLTGFMASQTGVAL